VSFANLNSEEERSGRSMGLRDEILEKLIVRTATVFKKKSAELSTETNFIEDLKAKSVNMVQIISVLEDEYDVEITFMEARRKKTIGEMADYIAELCGT
jgi:acyl carrier protein